MSAGRTHIKVSELIERISHYIEGEFKEKFGVDFKCCDRFTIEKYGEEKTLKVMNQMILYADLYEICPPIDYWERFVVLDQRNIRRSVVKDLAKLARRLEERR